MSWRWRAVARKDFDDAIRSRMLLSLTGIFTLVLALIVTTPILADTLPPVELIVYFVTDPIGPMVPLVAIVASYLAIAGERESGTLKVLLGLPPTRRDVVLGKFVGRTAVVLLATLVAYSVTAVLLVAVYGGLPTLAYAKAVLLTELLALSFVGLAVGFSAASPSRSRAMGPAVGLYLLLVVLWEFVGLVLPTVARWAFSIDLAASTVTVVEVLSPMSAYGRLIGTQVSPALVEGLGIQIGPGPTVVETAGAPWYLQDWFVIGLMLAWVVVPVLLGYWQFERTDLD